MKTIPSLIASSTIGIAATGLVLGKQQPSQVKKVRRTEDAFYSNYKSSSFLPRPGTSSTNFDVVINTNHPSVFSSESKKKQSFKSHRRPPLTHTNKSKFTHPPKPSSLKIKETASCYEYHPDEEDRTRESLSSRGSWIRRLSSRPKSHSQQVNSAPEVQNESSSQTCQSRPSSRHENGLVHQHRNRLVKRIPRGRAMSGSEAAVRSQQKANHIQRPATSQHHFYISSQENEDAEFSDHLTKDFITKNNRDPQSHQIWRLYFQPKSLARLKNLDSKKEVDQVKYEIPDGYHRVAMGEYTLPSLIKPEMIGRSRVSHLSHQDHSKHEMGHSSDEDDDDSKGSFFGLRPQSRDEITRRPRRSFSMQFVSPVAWLPRPGNIMGLRRNYRGKNPDHQTSLDSNVAKVCSNTSAHSTANTRFSVFEESTYQSDITVLRNSRPDSEQFTAGHNSKSRNSSSPLPSLSRFSTLSVDLDRVGLTSSSSSSIPSETINHVPNNCLSTYYDTSTAVQASFPSTGKGLSKNSRLSVNSTGKNLTLEIADRASTLVGSDYDVRGFTSWDEDDTDLQSETVYDSMRSGATGTTQPLKLPLEYIFDGTPPMVDYNVGLNISEKHETTEYDRFSTGRCQTMRDENLISSSDKEQYLLKTQYSFPSALTKIANRSYRFSESISIACLKLNGCEFKYPEDDDWNWEEKQSEPHQSLNYSSKYCRPKKRYERLRNLPLDENHDELEEPNDNERVKTNVFDWSEPSPIEKNDDNGNFPRPRTAHVKQLMDGRNGRALGRREPSAVHVRSQSVPVVPDADLTKVTSKFGTWGLSSKIITEDWDGDFEFENVDSDVRHDGDTLKESNGVFVPEAIKASQENIVGHVGQIREVCLLVEDLKRLRVQGKSRDLLDGEFQPLWLQADGIIALAAPVEEEEKTEQIETSIAKLNQRPPLSTQKYINSYTKVKLRSNNISSRSSRSGYNETKVEDTDSVCLKEFSRRSSHSLHHIHAKSSTEVARKVMESIHQQRSNSDPLLQNFAEDPNSKMPFDTTSLKDLVNRAAALSRALNQVIRVADGLATNIETHTHDSSPAFVRVFTDPMVSSPKIPCQKNSNSSNKVEYSSLSGPSQVRHMMAVG
ncbi:hypothetical protein GcC1_221007 [Golovinomyces cichoracearum]|uniref:Uncharacterized protein n=1 Tax=Golovinomyces cichoracearum TaxID=62708 RepID=A0A420H7Q3_9PEZI|nr:hypothetical protein GcC1_221007 [Golovinomyces cichoracearum]